MELATDAAEETRVLCTAKPATANAAPIPMIMAATFPALDEEDDDPPDRTDPLRDTSAAAAASDSSTTLLLAPEVEPPVMLPFDNSFV